MELQKFDAMRDMLNSVDMKLGYLGYATVDSKWKTDGLATPFHRLYFIESGTGTLSAGGESLILEPGKVYLLPAQLPCSYGCPEKLTQLFFHFNLTLADGFDLLRNVRKPAVLEVPQEQIAQLRQCCAAPSYAGVLTVRTAILSLLQQMHSRFDFAWDFVPEYSRCVAAAMQVISCELSSRLRVKDLAQRCFVSNTYLTRCFRREVGISVKEYVTLQLVAEAQRLLSHTEISVEKISGDLGFCDQFYFSEWFKRNCRVSPLQYRNGTRY